MKLCTGTRKVTLSRSSPSSLYFKYQVHTYRCNCPQLNHAAIVVEPIVFTLQKKASTSRLEVLKMAVHLQLQEVQKRELIVLKKT
jgi:hypothetical protein